jgi:predicted ABC-type ATPase
MREAKVLGYTVQIVYVCLNTAERCVGRVRERALLGGHDVPDEDIRRRYDRSLANLTAAIHLPDRAILFDNSGTERRKIVEIEHATVIWRAEKEPFWVITLAPL